MSLPHLLLVDDSEAILAYERAVLSGHYTLSTATDGHDALQKLARMKPAAVLLDLSMPRMDGEEVMAHMQLDPELAQIPVIVISSERERAERCLGLGAVAMLPKPIESGALLALVGRILEEQRRKARMGSMTVLFLGVGPREVGIPLGCVEMVFYQPATRPLPVGPTYLREMFEYRGAPVCILDVARRLGVEHSEPVSERKLVLVRHGELRIALCVDRVEDPVEIAPSDVAAGSQLGGSDHGRLNEALVAVVRTARGPLPVVDPRSFLSHRLLRDLPLLLQQLPAQPDPAFEVGTS